MKTTNTTQQINLSFAQTKELVAWLDADAATKEAESILEIRNILENQIKDHISLYGGAN